jgi:hypothetical protein
VLAVRPTTHADWLMCGAPAWRGLGGFGGDPHVPDKALSRRAHPRGRAIDYVALEGMRSGMERTIRNEKRLIRMGVEVENFGPRIHDGYQEHAVAGRRSLPYSRSNYL